VRLALLILIREQQLAPDFEHVPLHIAGEHAQEDVDAHAILQPMVDRADLQIHRFERAEGVLDLCEGLVAAHDLGRGQLFLWSRSSPPRRNPVP
jgi:hypothetical protein